MITGTLNNLESERYETEEEKNKRLQREANQAVANAIEQDMNQLLDVSDLNIERIRRD